ncbi:MAG: putative membrane protein [Kiritimatiellia bacterium]|jgi:uncharacterized membrane protein
MKISRSSFEKGIRLVRRGHDVLAEEAFFSLAICSGLAVTLLVARLYLTRKWELGFMAWNLFLAWVPYGLSDFGVYLGRGPGFNSWDLLTRPHLILAKIFHLVASPS